MTRARTVGLAVTVAVTAAAVAATALLVRAPAQDKGDVLAPLRAQAALHPCPTGVSSDLPDLTLACLGGGPPVALHGPPTGLPTLVNVYGSWCVPCQKEMPILAAFAKASAGRVALLGVDTEDPQRLALLFAKDVGQTWNAVVDDDKAVLRRYASGPPVTLFVDAAGKVVHVKVGPIADARELRSLTRRYFGLSV